MDVPGDPIFPNRVVAKHPASRQPFPATDALNQAGYPVIEERTIGWGLYLYIFEDEITGFAAATFLEDQDYLVSFDFEVTFNSSNGDPCNSQALANDTFFESQWALVSDIECPEVEPGENPTCFKTDINITEAWMYPWEFQRDCGHYRLGF